jgi:ankyrin repeat-rich membrane spanning protein
MFFNKRSNWRFCSLLLVLLLFFLIPNFGHTGDMTKVLLEAVKNGDVDSVKALIVKGTDVNAADLSGNTSLIYAAKFGHSECVKVLLENGAYVNSQCNLGGTPLMWSAENGNAEIVKVLIDNGADLNSCDFYGWTPLMKAVYGGHVAAVQALVENKAKVNIKNNGGITAWYIAELKAQPEILRLLAEAGAIK